jgi:hypothetical protein
MCRSKMCRFQHIAMSCRLGLRLNPWHDRARMFIVTETSIYQIVVSAWGVLARGRTDSASPLSR